MKITLKREKVYCGNLVLINAQYPIKCMDNGNLTTVDSYFPNVLLRSEAASALQKILSKIMAGKEIVPVSGYRSMKEQIAIYQNSLRDNGEAFTNQFVALPGHSEHQTGLAIDLGQNQKKIDFGFVERYPKEKETITGIAHEPWHFRYVGYPHSRIMVEHSLTLEEYVNFIKSYREDDRLLYSQEQNTAIEVYYVPALKSETTIIIPEQSAYQISGNNVDGFIITIRRKVNGQI